MAMVTSNGNTLLKAVKPFKTGWKVEIKVLHSWTQHSSYGGGDTLEFILADVTGDKIHRTYVIGQAIDIGDLQVVQFLGKERKKLELTLTDTNDQHITCCLWGRFAEQVLNSYHVGEENTIVCLVRFAKISVYKGQVQVTNAFEASSVIINSTGSDVNEFLRQLPKNELALTTGNVEVVKPKGIKRQKDTWCIYPERSIVDIIMATEVTNITKTILLDPKQPLRHVWRCGTCHQNVTSVEPKFKLHLLLKDDTGETKVMLLDTIAEPIVGVSADELLNGSLEETEDYNDEDSHANALSFEMTSGQISLLSNENEDGTCSASTPLSKRSGDNQIDDLASTTKKHCSKAIKMEKKIKVEKIEGE
ncbi:hypothetical protein DY000_02013664 [Brassica cretica]|uniref:Replication protein A OB domain-containing protein n=1 Tax=Brassica cretica TaxID=69181 RepID=A0ABQ7DCF3_BRACR|nr:hypothetical protein DY000_02013664 [Brassica cretica]